MNELESFYNDGFGWICKRCERELKSEADSETKRSRLMTEGEAESKTPKFSNRAMAKWVDKLQNTLVCPRCGVTETTGNSGDRF